VGVDVAGETFAATGKVVTRNGWRDVYQEARWTQDADKDARRQRHPAPAGDAARATA
jgi:DNA topoisomerase-3